MLTPDTSVLYHGPRAVVATISGKRVPLMADPFCPALARVFGDQVARLQRAPFRRVHGQDAHVILNRWHYGAFESAAQAMLLRHFGQSVGCPVITGDCVSPPLARVCGMHVLYYHIPSNWAEGLRPEDLTWTLDRMYVDQLPNVIGELELALLARLDEPTDCHCRDLLRARPPDYRQALSPRIEAAE
ncbi:MAG: hypothetical protein LC797_06440 [Chloroflexi bacterium]|nr:hypothetical protein [Chloroflexota bacterium]